jgi:hypothetical protein
MYKLCFFVPESHLEIVKNALFHKGAGRIGEYGHCSWQVLGEGQFMPLKGSNPYIGTQDKTECVAEYKVEMVCEENLIGDVINELIEKHPYEEPAYEIYQILTRDT